VARRHGGGNPRHLPIKQEFIFNKANKKFIIYSLYVFNTPG